MSQQHTGAEPAVSGTPAPAGTNDQDDAGTENLDVRTGAEQPWDPEDLTAARGQDPTPRNVERSRRDLAEQGPAAIEKTVP